MKQTTFNTVDKKLLVIDNASGCYIPLAIQLSKYFTKTGFYAFQQSPFPKLSLSKVGSGYDEIIREEQLWSNIDNYDVFLIPDIYLSDIGNHLRKMGKIVVGGSNSDVIETDRHLFKGLLERVGLPSAPTQNIVGIKELRRYLKQKRSQDSYVKISTFRGEMETFGHKNWNYSEIFVNELEQKLGPLSEEAQFIVEEGIDCVTETGYDGYSVNGQYPSKALFGCEVKDVGYLGSSCDYKDLPDPVQYVNDKFAPVLKSYRHNGFFSTEIRYTKDGTSYFTDPTMRAGNPPSNVMVRMIDNWGEILMGIGQNQMVEPNFIHKYGCEIILKSSYANTNYLPIQFPQEFTDNINLKCSFKMNEQHYIIPITDAGYDMVEIGSVVVCGDNVEDILNRAVEIAKSVEGYQLTFDDSALEKAQEEINKLEKALNIKF